MSPVTTEIDVLDLFCGCGGLSAGFASASSGTSFRILGGVDNDAHACATYEKQIGAPAIQLDVRRLARSDRFSEALTRFGKRGAGPLVVIGGPPCQGFSAHRKKDARSDERNNLVELFFDLALRLSPEFVVMENVPEIFDAKHWPAIQSVIRSVERAGYRVRARIYNLADFGVPQARYRAVIVARRAGRCFNMPEPLPGAHRTVRDAIASLPAIAAGQRDAIDPMHVAPAHTARVLSLINSIPRNGGSRREADRSLLPSCHETVDGFRDVYGRLWWDKPSISITAKSSTPSCGRFLHPEQNRNISVREAALLQGFPATFQFSGPLVQLYRQIGNAVSPLFATALAEVVRREIEEPSKVLYDAELDILGAGGRSFTSSIAGRKRSLVTGGRISPRPVAIDLFAGAGGLSLGLQQAGFDVAFALDNDPDAVRTYRYNLGSHIHLGSATEIAPSEIVNMAGLRPGECDLLVGGPPCQGFSQHRRGSDDDARNELVGWFAEVVQSVRPRSFLFENVPYIAAKRGRETLSAFMRIVQGAGYSVHTSVVDASDYGVPQRRQRFIAIGFRECESVGYSIPLTGEQGEQCVQDAIGNLPTPPLHREHPDYANHIASAISELNRLRISFVPEGGGWQDIPEDYRLDCHVNHRGHGHLDVYGRLNWLGLAQTITAHSDSFSRGRYAHPVEDRPLTGRELAALQSFPQWFRFVADKKSVARLVGNAVPPALAVVLASSIKDELERIGRPAARLRSVA